MTGRLAARSAFALASLSAALVAAPAYAHTSQPATTNITCGESITKSITVANDLTCAGNALSIDAQNVTVNLNGHTLTGNGTGTGVSFGLSQPVAVPGDVLKGGTVDDFASAVAFGQVDDPVLNHVSMSDDGSSSTEVIETRGGNLAGGADVENSTIVQSAGYVLFAQVEDGGGITFTKTVITDGKVEVSQTGPAKFVDDTFTDSPLTLSFEGAATISGSKFIDSPVVDGPLYSGDVIENSTFEEDQSGTALTIDDMNDEQVTGNTFSHNLIGFYLLQDANGPIGGETVSVNTFTANTAAGLLIDATATSGPSPLVTVSGNTANRNGTAPAGTVDAGGNPVAGGIHIYDPSSLAISVTGSTTAHNSGYGIWTVPGTVTGSNNNSTADQHQCNPTTLCTY